METLQRTANRGSVSTGYEIDNSCMFDWNGTNTAGNGQSYMYDTSWTGTPTSTTTGCFSTWFKNSLSNPTNSLGVASFVNNYSDGNNRSYIMGDWGSGGNFVFGQKVSGSWNFRVVSNALYRDPAAHYHFFAVWDTSNSTESERIRLYVNGERITSLSDQIYPSQNQECYIVSKEDFSVGRAYSSVYGNFTHGYMAETHFVDGTAYAPTDFGEFDEDSGIWKPKQVSVSYGNKGFYLDYKDASNLGNDASGNNRDLTLSAIDSTNQATDTPTNNGCTLNILASLEGSNDITEGGLVSTGGSGSLNGTYGTMGIDPFNSTVDWYWEIEASSTTNGSSDDIGIGWIKESRITSGSTTAGNVYGDGISRYSSQTATSAGDIWGVLLETGTTPVFKLYRNDSLIYTATHGSGGVSFDTLMFPYITVKGTGTDARLNFLNPASSFSIASGNTDPNGYGNFEFDTKNGYALCTKNLAEYG